MNHHRFRNFLLCLSLFFLSISNINAQTFINTTIEIDEVDIICLDTSGVISIDNLCPTSSDGNVDFFMDPISICVFSQGVALGIDTFCIVTCDINAVCDTTVLEIEVVAGPETNSIVVRDTIGISEQNTFCFDTSVLEGNIVSIDNFCSLNSIVKVNFQIDPINLCVDYQGVDFGTDRFCGLICDDFGVCDTTILEIVVEDFEINRIEGQVLLDLDGSNCNSNAIPLSNIMVNCTDGSEVKTTFTSNGAYNLFPDIGDYTTSIMSTQYTSNPLDYSHSFSEFGNTETANFCLSPSTLVNDLSVTLLPLNSARPGFEVRYQLTYQNRGNQLMNGNVMLEFDNANLNFSSASTSISNQTTNSLTFNFIDLLPSKTENIFLKFNILPPPNVNSGDLLVFNATINPISGDNFEADNTFDLSQNVVNSFDPNDIRVLEGPQVLVENADKYLHYIVRFQNTGTASAINVRVENTLDDLLDWQTFQLESTSHDARVEISDGNQVTFEFEDILLPDSTSNEPASHGFVAYRIKPVNGIQVGDIISNSADIYFDFNEPIFTNTVTTEFINMFPVATIENESTLFSTYPNPTTGIVFIESENPILELEIVNRLGQSIQTKFNSNKIDLSENENGLYFCKLKDDQGNVVIIKIMKL